MRRHLLQLSTLLLLAAAGCTGTARLRAFDDLVVTGQVVTLRAKLERGRFLFWGRDVEGAKIRFEILHLPRSAEKKEPVYLKLAEEFTDSDGVASVEMKGFFEGTHLIRSTYMAATKVQSLARVFTLKPGTPVLVCDIDHTIADVSKLGFLTSSPEDIPVLPGAVEALRELSARYGIVYLTARDDSFYDATMQWLHLKGFPIGPVFFSDLSKTAFLGSALEFKSAKLRTWREAGLNLRAGIGDRPEDISAYLENGMKAFLITEEPGDVPEGAEAARSWAGIAGKLLK